MTAASILRRPQYALVLILALTTLAYWPGLTGGFAFDDYPNILLNPAITDSDLSVTGLANAAWSGVAGPLKRPIAMISFVLNYDTTGGSPLAFKLTNLGIHLLNGLLVFWFAILILRARAALRGAPRIVDLAPCALAVSAIWLIHPLNLTSVLYVVQRMTSLAATFSLLAIICFCLARFRMIGGRPGGNLFLFFGFLTFAAMGALSKENALLVLPLAALTEVCFFRLRTNKPRDRFLLLLFFSVILVIPGAAVCSYLFLHPDWLSSLYEGRPFSLLERGLTETRVLWFYVALLLLPRLKQMALFHDDFAVSAGLFDPMTTVFAVAAVIASIVLAIAWIRRFPMFAYAILWFVIGHAMESTLIPLELVHEHRNYFPSVGLFLGIAVGVVEFARITGARWLPSTAACGSYLVFGALTLLRAGDWSDPVTLASIEVERNPRSFRTVYEFGRIQYGLYLMRHDERDYHNAIATLERSLDLDPSAKRPIVELMKVTYVHGDEPKPAWKEELVRRYADTSFGHTEWVDLHNLVKCHAERECEFPHGTVIEFFAAALSNPTVSQHTRAQLMVDLGIFYVNEVGDYGPAIALLDDAVKIRPREFDFNAVRAEILVLTGRLDEAEEAIDYLGSIDTWDDYFRTPQTRVAELEQMLRGRRQIRGD
ncbi:MAG: tetratricopeptide repeat protein [Gammaproteobacteria bacterium]|jgi:hypothetical protein|nr:tetratricopeptide repeat protein [Gammaproteobacteria bacterium]